MLVCIAACGLAPEVALLPTRLTHQAPCGRCRHLQHILQDFADPSSPDKKLRPLPAMASAKSVRFRFSFLGFKYGVWGS